MIINGPEQLHTPAQPKIWSQQHAVVQYKGIACDASEKIRSTQNMVGTNIRPAQNMVETYDKNGTPKNLSVM